MTAPALPRRARGTGTIERYRGRLRALFPFEIGRPTVVGVYDTREEAERALEAILVRIAQENGGVRGTPLRKIVDEMFVRRRAEGYASVGTEESDWKSYLSRHPLSERTVQTLTQAEVMSAILAMKGRTARNKGRPLSLSTRKKLLNLVRAALYLAKQKELVPLNVLADAKFADPKGNEKRKKRKKRALTWEQFEALFAASGMAPELVVAIWTCCRQGELRALHWRDVHNVEGTACTCDEHRSDPHLVIRYGRPPGALDDPEECTTKSGEPHVVSLFGRALHVFRTLPRDRQNRRGESINTKGIVFCSRLGDYRAKGRLVGRKAWQEWKRVAGLPWLRWHDLRHTGGTWLVRGVLGPAWPLEAVKEHMGHSEVKITERYADQRKGTNAAAMAEVMRNPSEAHHPSEGGLTKPLENQSRFRDLNSRPTVYEGGGISCDPETLDRLAGLSMGFVDAVRSESPFIIARGLDLAAAVDEIVAASRGRAVELAEAVIAATNERAERTA